MTQECKALKSCREGTAGLGNRQLNKLGKLDKEFPWCTSLGLTCKLDELHVLLDCPAVGYERYIKGISLYMDIKSRLSHSHPRIMKDYLGGDGSNAHTVFGKI